MAQRRARGAALLDQHSEKSAKVEKKKEEAPAPLDGLAIRRLIATNMVQASIKKRTPGMFVIRVSPFRYSQLVYSTGKGSRL